MPQAIKSIGSLFIAAKTIGGFSEDYLSSLSKTISIQKQARHLLELHYGKLNNYLFMENLREFIDIKCALIDIFLLQMTENILDISYSLSSNDILLQIVLLEDTSLDENVIDKVYKYLSDYTISIKTIFLSKKQFNETPGDFSPIYYTWLTYNLYSKAETL